MGDLEAIQQIVGGLNMDPQTIMAFLAGAGVNTIVKALRKLVGQPPSADTPHRAGMRIEGSPEGGETGITIAPQMLSHLARQAGGGGGLPAPPPGPNPLAMLAGLG